MRFYEQPGMTRNDSGRLSELYILRPTNGLFRDGFTVFETVMAAAVVAGFFAIVQLVCSIAWLVSTL